MSAGGSGGSDGGNSAALKSTERGYAKLDAILTPPFWLRIQRFAGPNLSILSVVYHI
jgi:hypothetical protein